jgi:hypothetical protein
VRIGVVPELDHKRMPLERGLDDAALHTASAAVNEPHLPQARASRRLQVVTDDRRNVARRERVKVDLRADREDVRIIHGLIQPHDHETTEDTEDTTEDMKDTKMVLAE